VKKIEKRQYQKGLRKVSVSVLLLTYLTFWFYGQSNLLHDHLPDHDHEHVVHDSKAESDPCHRSIYHGDLTQGCKHDAHLLKDRKSCDLCDALRNIHAWLPELPKLYSPKGIHSCTDSFRFSAFYAEHSNPSNKGPPAFLI
jgi:hypothetical protein